MSDIMNKIDFSYDADKDKNTQFKEALQKELDDAFGKDKVTVDHTDRVRGSTSTLMALSAVVVSWKPFLV